MGKEIERKFIVYRDRLYLPVTGSPVRQGYLVTRDDFSIRVRIQNDSAVLTIKGGQGRVRDEYEYPIPVNDAREFLERYCSGQLIKKTRYHMTYDDRLWEVDVFEGDNAGLVLAEIELDKPDEELSLPNWVEREVTDDPRYLNASLSVRPYRHWE